MVFYNALKEEFLKKIEGERKLICYGCGQEWQRTVKILDLYNKLWLMIDNVLRQVEVRFPDNTIRQYTCFASTEVGNEIKIDDEQECILLITSIYWQQIIADIEKHSILKNIEVYIWPLMEVAENSYESMYEKRLIMPAKEYYEKLLGFQKISQTEQKKLIEKKEKFLREKDVNGEFTHLVIPKIVFFLTTRCTLKCKECTALIPHFKKQIDINVDQVLEDMKRVLEVVDEVIYVQLAGGESLLYPELETVLKFLISNEKVLGITFVTNATINPNEKILGLLTNPKVYIVISDYGVLKNLYNIVTLFEKRKIAFELIPNMVWQKVGGTEKRNKEAAQLKFEYLRCGNGKGCKMIVNGYLHICDRSARMFMLGDFKSMHDYFPLMCETSERRSKIQNMYLSDYAEACDHCDYANVEAEKIEPAIQEGKDFQRSAYTIVKRC